MTDDWDDDFDDEFDDEFDEDDFEAVRLGFKFIAAGAFDELELGPLLDAAAGKTISPVVKAICLNLLDRPEYAFYNVLQNFEGQPYKVLLDPEVRLCQLNNKAAYKVLDLLGSLDLETLYRSCVQRAQHFLKSTEISNNAEDSAEQESKKTIFFASGQVNLLVLSSVSHGPDRLCLSFNALLDGKSKLPLELSFAEIPADQASALSGSKGSKERCKALISLLERSELSGSVLELSKALNIKGVREAAQKAGVEVYERNPDAAKVKKAVCWTLWEFLQKDEVLTCAPQTLKSAERVHAVGFILSLSLLLWYFIGVRVREICSRLKVSDLIEETAAQSSKKKGAAAAQVKPINMQVFHRELCHLLAPELFIYPASGELEFDCVTDNLAAVVKELGPCYQRFLQAETYDVKELLQQLGILD